MRSGKRHDGSAERPEGGDSTPQDTPQSTPQSARRHHAVRRANQSETAEDYVEAIDDLMRARGEARVRDLAGCFGVSHVTVSRTVERLKRDGLAITEPYRSIELTEAGQAMAAAARKRHAAVLRFLLALGVPLATAIEDSEGIEHHVGEATLAAFDHFVTANPPAPGDASALSAVEDQLPNPERFKRVREAHATELVEDYVEAIGDLIDEKGQARVVDLAAIFGVSHVTVSRTIGRLQRDGYALTEPYRPIELTERGRLVAESSRQRHATVLAFLIGIGVPVAAAEVDAEGVEHHVSAKTLELFSRHTGAR